jgi:predicted NBD/HSP70 family sugar kinase
MKKKILVLDVGGTNVKVLLTGQRTPLRIPSGTGLSARRMVAAVQQATQGWKYDAVTIGIPAPVIRGRILKEPANLGSGWMRFDFEKAFRKPVRIINDAAMQALGSYVGGTMLFLGLGTGLGSALIVDGALAPMEIAHMPFRKGTYEDYVGLRGYKKHGKRKWRKYVFEVAAILKAGLVADYVVFGGGQTKLLKRVPDACRLGSNDKAFTGGQRLWEQAPKPAKRASRPLPRRRRPIIAVPAPAPAPLPDAVVSETP